MKISKKFVAIFLIVLGLLLMAMVPLKNYLVQSHQQQAVSQITKATVKRNRKKKGDFQFDKVHTLQVIFLIGLFHLFEFMLILICTLWKGGWLNG